jgi:hydrogenase expression/formation protein HypC
MCLGVPGEVIEFDTENTELPTALVEFAGIRRRVCMACVPDAKPGEFVIVHAGIAISRIDPDEARRVFAYLHEIGESDGWDEERRSGDVENE